MTIRAYVPFSLFPLLRGRFRIGRIEIEQPAVEVAEGDLYASSSTEDSKGRRLDLEIKGIKVRKGSFVYTRERPGRKGGRLGLSGINATVGHIGSSDRLRAGDAGGTANGVLEESGQFQLQVRAKIFAEIPDVDVKLQIAGQNLATLNRFFMPNDGVRLRGTLIEGRSSVVIRGSRLNASDYVRFRDFAVTIKKHKGLDAFSAFFQTFFASLKMGRQNTDGGNYDRLGTVNMERRPKETLISFTLRGMKEAAIKVTTQGGG